MGFAATTEASPHRLQRARLRGRLTSLSDHGTTGRLDQSHRSPRNLFRQEAGVHLVWHLIARSRGVRCPDARLAAGARPRLGSRLAFNQSSMGGFRYVCRARGLSRGSR